jgi:hypothetical protein
MENPPEKRTSRLSPIMRDSRTIPVETGWRLRMHLL